MKKHMVGDVVVVVIDEIGEVTFFRDPLQPHIVEIGKKESVERAYLACVELVDFAAQIIPVSPAQYELLKALEYLQKDQKWLVDRLSEQVEFSDAVRTD